MQCSATPQQQFWARHNAIQSIIWDSGIWLDSYSSSDTLSHSALSLSALYVSWFRGVIVKGTINASSLFPLLVHPLYLKVMAFSRVCYMQNYTKAAAAAAVAAAAAAAAAAADRTLVSTLVTKFSRGSSLQHHRYSRSFPAQGHTVQMMMMMNSWES